MIFPIHNNYFEIPLLLFAPQGLTFIRILCSIWSMPWESITVLFISHAWMQRMKKSFWLDFFPHVDWHGTMIKARVSLSWKSWRQKLCIFCGVVRLSNLWLLGIILLSPLFRLWPFHSFGISSTFPGLLKMSISWWESLLDRSLGGNSWTCWFLKCFTSFPFTNIGESISASQCDARGVLSRNVY